MALRLTIRAVVLLISALLLPTPAAALDDICDPARSNCRVPLINLIRAETVGIDVAFWLKRRLFDKPALVS